MGTVALAALLALSACGTGEDKNTTTQVASLPSASAPSDPSKAPERRTSASVDDSARPQLRIDDSDERRDRIIHAWDACLLAHGAEVGGPGVAGPPGSPQPIKEPIPEAAKQACVNKAPIGVPEFDPDLNPHYRENWQVNVRCLQSKGLKVHLASDTSTSPKGLTWTFDEGAPPLPDNMGQIERECELAAFRDKK